MSRTDTRKSILFLIPTLTGGGAERVIVTLLNHLDRARFALTLAVVDTRDAKFRSDIAADVEFIDLGQRRVRHALPQIVQLVWRRRPDVVFSTLGHLNLALAALRPLLPRGPRYVARESNVPSHQLNDQRHPILWRWLYRQFYRNHDLVVCQSHAMLADLETNFGLPPARGVVIHNPIDVDRIRQLAADGAPTKAVRRGTLLQLVAAGRLVPQKGFDLLIEAIALLPDVPLRLTILGEGPLRDKLSDLVHRHGLEERVQMIGFQTNPYVWFSRADAFVLSSRYEGLPNAVLEALACGTPVIATPAAGVATEVLETIPQCVLASDASAAGIAEAIRRWLQSGGRAIPDTAVAAYRVERIVGQYQSMLASL
jgi:glycosyltransferase involved in cell wall biosynthesis